MRLLAVSEQASIFWRAECGGVRTCQVKRPKAPELKNTCLRKAVSDRALAKLILAEATKGNF